MNRVFLCLMICLVFSLSALAQDPTPAPTTVAQPQTGGGFPGLPGREPEIRPYERVITKDAKSDDGLFTVHRIKDSQIAWGWGIGAYSENFERWITRLV